MEQRIRDRYSDEILAEARARYAIDADRIAALDGFESYIYEFSRRRRRLHPAHRPLPAPE